jgi:hypothetical protein
MQGLIWSASDNVGIQTWRHLIGGQRVDNDGLRDCGDFNLVCPNLDSAEHLAYNTASLPDGPHTVTAEAVDRAGNPASASATFSSDNHAPAPPQNLAVDGGDAWRAKPGFRVTWTNPGRRIFGAPARRLPAVSAAHWRVRERGKSRTNGQSSRDFGGHRRSAPGRLDPAALPPGQRGQRRPQLGADRTPPVRLGSSDLGCLRQRRSQRSSPRQRRARRCWIRPRFRRDRRSRSGLERVDLASDASTGRRPRGLDRRRGPSPGPLRASRDRARPGGSDCDRGQAQGRERRCVRRSPARSDALAGRVLARQAHPPARSCVSASGAGSVAQSAVRSQGDRDQPAGKWRIHCPRRRRRSARLLHVRPVRELGAAEDLCGGVLPLEPFASGARGTPVP